MAAIGGRRHLPVAQREVDRAPGRHGLAAPIHRQRVVRVEAAQQRGAEGIGQQHRVEALVSQAVIALVRGIEAERVADPQRGGPVERGFQPGTVAHQAAEAGRIGIARQIRHIAGLDDVALGLGQQAGIVPLKIEVEARRTVDPEIGRLHLLRRIAAVPWLAVFAFDLAAGEIVLEDDVDHPLVRCIAILLRHLLREHLEFLDRFGRIAPQLTEGGNAHAVDEDDREPAAAATACTGDLRTQFLDQLGNRTGAISGDILLVEFEDRRMRRFELADQPPAEDDNRILVIFRGKIRLRRLHLPARTGRGVLRLCLCLRRKRHAAKQGKGKRAMASRAEKTQAILRS